MMWKCFNNDVNSKPTQSHEGFDGAKFMGFDGKTILENDFKR